MKVLQSVEQWPDSMDSQSDGYNRERGGETNIKLRLSSPGKVNQPSLALIRLLKVTRKL